MMYSEIKDTVYFALIWHWSEVKQKPSDKADVSCFSGEALANQSRLGIPHGWAGERMGLAQTAMGRFTQGPFPGLCDEEPKQTTSVCRIVLGSLAWFHFYLSVPSLS